MKVEFDGTLRVKDLIEYLSKLNPEARLVYGEQNGAMLGSGYWQHMVDFMLPQCIRTVRDDKDALKSHYVNDRMDDESKVEYTAKYEEAVKNDYMYVSDDDIIIQI